jgi:peptide/nickel transport system ATP-binding protein
MYLGEFVETAPTAELFDQPTHPYTKSLLSAVPRINPGSRPDRILLEGTVPSPLNPPSGCRFHTRCPVTIPPEDWSASEEAFRAGFRFRKRIEASELDVDAIRIRLEAETDAEVSDDDLATHILADQIDTDVDSLPAEYADVLRTATNAIVAEEDDEAKSVLGEVFTSPCERHVPEIVDVEETHDVRCHRYDPARPGEPDAM